MAPANLTLIRPPYMHVEEQPSLLSPTSENEQHQPASLYYDEKFGRDDAYWSPAEDKKPAISPVVQVKEVLSSPLPDGEILRRSSISEKRPALISYDELPQWYQDNPFITHGYRPVSRSTSASFRSWFYLHNETVNIYSHLIPGLIYLFLEIGIAQWINTTYPNATIGDHLVFAFYLLTVTICLCLSAAFHTLMNHSEKVSDLFLKLDLVGIIILTLGSFVSGIYTCFYCERQLQIIYWSMILTLGTIDIFIMVSPTFQGLRWRTFRVSAFVATGFTGIAPLIHGFIIFGSKEMWDLGTAFYCTEGAMFLLGAGIYATRFPESLKRFTPGTFDILAASHQIFHILVVGAVICHTLSLVIALDYNQASRMCVNGHG